MNRIHPKARAVLFGLAVMGLVYSHAIAMETLWVSSSIHSQDAAEDFPGAIDLKPTNTGGAVGSFLFTESLFGGGVTTVLRTPLTVVETGAGTWQEVWVSSLTAPHFLKAGNNHHHVLRDNDGTTHVLSAAYTEDPYLSTHRLEYRNSATGWAVEPLIEGNIHSEALALDPGGGIHAACLLSGPVLAYFRRGTSTWDTEVIPPGAYSPWGPLSLTSGSDLRPIVAFHSGTHVILLKKNGEAWVLLKDVPNGNGRFLLRTDSQDRLHLAVVDADTDHVRYVRLSSSGILQTDLLFPAPNATTLSDCGLALDENDAAHIAVTSVLINTETGESAELPFSFKIPSVAFVQGRLPYLFGLLSTETPATWMALAPLNRSTPPTMIQRSTDSVTWSLESLPPPVSGYRLLRTSDRTDLTGLLSPADTQWTIDGLGPNTALRVLAQAVYPGFVTDSDASPSVYSLAKLPSFFSLSQTGGRTLSAAWQMNGNPTGTRFKIDVIPPSGIVFTEETTEVGWTSPSLDPGQPYAVTVRALNGDDVETVGSSVTRVSFTGNTREMAFSLTGGLSVAVRVVGPSETEPAVAVMPEESFPPPPETLVPTGVGFRLSAAPPLGKKQSGSVAVSWPSGRLSEPAKSTLILARYDGGQGAWIPLTSSVGTDSLSARIAGDGIFQVMARALETPDAFVPRALPNPFRPDREPLTIRGAAPGTEIRIMDIRGKRIRGLIADADGTATWNGTDTAGDPAGSGIYSIAVDNGTHPSLRVLLKR